MGEPVSAPGRTAAALALSALGAAAMLALPATAWPELTVREAGLGAVPYLVLAAAAVWGRRRRLAATTVLVGTVATLAMGAALVRLGLSDRADPVPFFRAIVRPQLLAGAVTLYLVSLARRTRRIPAP